MQNHKHYKLCYRAHYNTSHTPEKRAADWCASFDADVALAIKYGGNVEKLEALFVAWMGAKTRCASSMITGPAGFNVRRNEKANAAEHKHGLKYCAYVDALKKAHDTAAFYEANPLARPIKSNDPDALERLQAKLAAAEAHYDAIKATPKAKRPHGYTLQYAADAVRELKARIALLEKAKATPLVEVKREGFTVTQNPTAQRVQITFDQRPDRPTCDRLKSLGFKWAPSLGVWQRHLNGNGIHAAKQFMQSQQVGA